MYYDEQVIGGVLCYRSTPNGEWIPFTSKELTEKYMELSHAACALKLGVFEHLDNPNLTTLHEIKEYAIQVDRAL